MAAILEVGKQTPYYIKGLEYGKHSSQQIIYSPGENATYFYRLISGEVEIYSYSTKGTKDILTILQQASFFGVETIAQIKQFTTFAEATTQAKVDRYGKGYLPFILNQHPALAEQLMTDVAAQCLYLFRLMELRQLTTENRLITLIERSVLVPNTTQERSITHARLAEVIGATRETVSNALGKLRHSGRSVHASGIGSLRFVSKHLF